MFSLLFSAVVLAPGAHRTPQVSQTVGIIDPLFSSLNDFLACSVAHRYQHRVDMVLI